MGDRYYATGVQLGIIKAQLKAAGQPVGMINEIADNQFIGRIEEHEKESKKVAIVLTDEEVKDE